MELKLLQQGPLVQLAPFEASTDEQFRSDRFEFMDEISKLVTYKHTCDS